MSLVPYTNTYSDVDGSIADSIDIVAEFDRVALFIAAWSDSYESIGLNSVNNILVPGDGDYDVEPTLGLVQLLFVDAVAELININIKDRIEGDPYRIYLNMRFGSKSTQFTVSAPSGKTHIFGINRTTYSPSQVVNKGRYAASLIVTYGSEGVHVQVYADNSETNAPDLDDLLQEISV